MDLLTLPQWLTLAIILATLALLALEVLRVDVTAMLALVALVVTGVLPAEHALDGFSSDPVMAVAGALVLSAAIVQTGIADRIGDTIGRLAGQGTLRALVVLMLATAAMSAFTHHLMVTAMMVPVAIGVARGGAVPPSRYLMPVSLAASIGATLTLIGAPAFLVADHVLQRAGVADFGLFSVTPVSAVLVGVAVLYTLTLGRLVLPDRDGETPDDERFGLGRYYTEVLVQPGSPYIGMDLASFRERTQRTFAVQDWLRDRRSLRPGFEAHVLAAGDVLLVRAAPDAIASLAAERGLALHAVAQYGEERDADDSELFGAERLSQLVIAPRSALGGRSLAEVDFRERYGVVVVGLWRRDGWLGGQLANVRLTEGDALVVWGEPKALDKLRSRPEFLLAVPFRGRRLRRSRAGWALVALVGAVVCSATGLLPVPVAFVSGATLAVLMRCLSPEEAYDSLELRVIVFIAAAMALGAALDHTGLSALAAGAAGRWLEGLEPFWVLVLLYAAAALLTQLLSDAATVVLLGPIAARLAIDAAVGVSPQAAVVCIALGATTAFLTPLGHHGNLLVYVPGGYRFADFLRVGTVLTVLFALASAWMALRLWPGLA